MRKAFLINVVAGCLLLFIGVSAQGVYTYTTLDVPEASETYAYGVGSGDGEFNSPYGVALSDTGHVYEHQYRFARGTVGSDNPSPPGHLQTAAWNQISYQFIAVGLLGMGYRRRKTGRIFDPGLNPLLDSTRKVTRAGPQCNSNKTVPS